LLTGAHARDEHLHRRVGHRLLDAAPGGRHRQRQARHALHPLAGHPQGFAAAQQQRHPRRAGLQRAHQMTAGAEQHVGAIEHQQ